MPRSSTKAEATKTEAIKQEALARAMQLFWQRGPETASYPEIVAATGLSRKALYAAWPDKEALIRDAMALYRAEVLGPMLAPLLKGGQAGLVQFWDGVVRAVRQPGWAGCFLFRSAAGICRSDPVLERHLREHMTMLRYGISRAVAAGQRQGDLPAGIDPEEAGWAAASIAGMISSYGALSGFSEEVTALIATGRSVCGLPPSP